MFFFETPTRNTTDLKRHGLPFSHSATDRVCVYFSMDNFFTESHGTSIVELLAKYINHLFISPYCIRVMSLTFYGAHSRVMLKPSKMKDARSAIDCVVRNDSKVVSVHNGEREFVLDEVRGQMGSKAWTVVFESEEGAAIKCLRDRMDRMDRKEAEYGKKFQVLEDTTVVPFVKNVAAQNLLFLVGAQPKVPPPVSHRFDSMLESVKNRVSGCADKLGFTEEKFCNMAEAILGRRNHTIHPESVVELAELTKRAVEMVNAFPNIESVCQSEVAILRAYEEISLFFP